MIRHIDDFLQKSVQLYPEKTAFVEGDLSINYKDFNTLSQKLASEISSHLKHSFTQESVLILLPKGIACLISFFGVAKSGHFYTLLDEKSPKERLEKIKTVLKPKLLITSKAYDFEFLGIKTLYCEDFSNFKINENALIKAKEKHIDTNLLYVFFTSGSTGLPKGVSIAHKSVIDYTFWVCETFKLDEHEILANQAPFYFDNSILDIFSSIKAGACVHILENSLFAFPAKVLSYLEQHHISMIFWVPSVLIYFANTQALDELKLSKLKKVLFCGEIMPNKALNYWRKHLPKAEYANLYGPTEITDVCCFYKVNRNFKDEDILPIGKACHNTQLLVFDENLKLIDEEQVGVKGELFVRGTSLALGYYNDKDKTSLAFIQNPLHNAYLDLVYKTGDIVAYNEFGELLCYGRKDNQIKIKGHRVELGEIESIINAHKDIKNCACIYKDERIICFYESKLLELDFKGFLKDKLPSYMLPSKFMALKHFKLNQNGKIDKKALYELV
ncbi:amino acid adenylation protein [Campylobacter sp. MIT 12-5580]|uniref:amino acid adenylation domain-containing protein n=1 Tax=Campylobacter sp. MIT 12-5580 TaxID=2040651 RepID=UPI0010F5EC71|nr:amino acid adenylation domain-containing protein [Campylobacter sp. MIT 12-5580]TKX30216.1 amino acid adenylation protein [Campylobacter sp. MIT 12-5580]